MKGRIFSQLVCAIALLTGFFASSFVSSFASSAENSARPLVRQLENKTSLRVLFVGNSYFYYNDSLHNHVSRLVESFSHELGQQIEYKSATIGGASLDQHNIDSLLEPGRLGIDEAFDLVILQGSSNEPLSERRRRQFAATVTEFNTTITATGAATALYMTHSYVEPHDRFEPTMMRQIESLYIETANQINALVIPVGLAFEEAYRRQPDIVLHKSFDGSHPSLLGTYLAACVVYASVYDKSPIGSNYDYFGTIDKADALFLQTIAAETVATFFQR